MLELYLHTNSLPYTRRRSCLLDFEGSVAMVFSESDSDESVLSLWTLDYTCGKVSWTKTVQSRVDFKMPC